MGDEAARFADHHDAKGNAFADWDAAFRTWMRNAVKFRGERDANRNGAPRVQRDSGWSTADHAQPQEARRAAR